MGDSGKVMLLPRGEYYSATPYEELDCVYYQGRSYVCKQASTGHAPTDTTYWQPMTPDASAEIQALTNQINMNWSEGSKNYIPFPYAIASTATATGYNVSDLGDGGITISGTSTTGGSLLVQRFKLPVGTYKFTCAKNSDAPIGANTSSAHYYMFIYGINGSSSWVRSDQDIATRTFTVTDASAEILLSIYVANGDTAPTTSFYPMISLASITDPTYQPYAKTNVELTNLIKTMTISKTSTENGAVAVTEIRPSTHILLNAYVTNGDGRYDTLVSTPKGASSDTFIFWLCENYSTTVVTNSTVNITLVYMDK